MVYQLNRLITKQVTRMDVMQALLVEMEASVAKVQERMQKADTRGVRAVAREVAEMKEMEKNAVISRDAKEMALGVILAVEGLRMRDLEMENKKQKEEIQKLKEERDMLEWCVDKEYWLVEWLHSQDIVNASMIEVFEDVYKVQREIDEGEPSAYECGNIGDYDKFH